MNKVIAHAPAKINLALQVEHAQPGEMKHPVNTIMCTTALADILVFEFEAGSTPFSSCITIRGVDLDFSCINPTDNTLTKTVDCFEQEYGRGFLPSGELKVDLIKSIPTQAGLGGGSSNAAAMLRMLCWLAQVEPTSEKSLAVARAVGADVPFFLHAPKEGLCAHMDGYGDILARVFPQPSLSLVLVKPDCGVSAKKAYEYFDALYEDQKSRSSRENPDDMLDQLFLMKQMEVALEAGDVSVLAKSCFNDLQPAACKLAPPIEEIQKELMQQPGVLNASLSGSGSTVFAICENATAAQDCVQHFADKGLWAVATQS